MKKFGGKIYTYQDRRWELVKLTEGETFGKGFLDVGGGHKPEQAIRADIETRIFTLSLTEMHDPPHTLSGWHDYWFLKEVVAPEENEFGEVSP